MRPNASLICKAAQKTPLGPGASTRSRKHNWQHIRQTTEENVRSVEEKGHNPQQLLLYDRIKSLCHQQSQSHSQTENFWDYDRKTAIYHPDQNQ